MARKRASLKDKGPETLGLTQKKGRGLDILFGGPSKKKPTETSASAAIDPKSEAQKLDAPKQSEPTVKKPTEKNNRLAGLVNEAPIPPPPAPAVMTAVTSESLPVNEADDEADITSSEEVVDELGLPVAMESPPPDLELATPVAEPAPRPVAPTPPPLFPPVSPPLSGVDKSDDLSGLATEDDLSGLEDDLSGLAAEAEAAPAPATIPPANLPPSPPPPTAAPAEVKMAPPVYKPPAPSTPRTYTPPVSPPPSPAPYQPPTPASSTTYAPRPATLGTPPSTATGAPSLSMPRSKIESVSGIVTERMKIEEKDLMPEDIKDEEGRYIPGVEKRAEVAEDEAKAQKVTRYIGRERRENLDREIERLYDEVASKLDKLEEVTAAFKILHEAQDIIFEDARQYDEAIYRVATVKAMLAHKRQLVRWSYTWGLFVFFYALTWLIAFFAGLLFRDQLSQILGTTSEMVNVIRSGWFPAVAGGIGGVTGILYSLYWHVSKARDFDPQYIMYYLTQPILGFILGAVFYFIVAAGFLTFNRGDLLDTFGVTALYVFLGWSAGYRQRFVLEAIEKIIRYVLRRPNGTEEAKSPTSPTPAEEVEGVKPPPGEAEK
jgi:hypothetical protein